LLLFAAPVLRAADFPPFTAVAGTQTFGPRYGFTTNTLLIETAEAIHGMGSEIIKFDLSEKGIEGYVLPPFPAATSMVQLVRDEPSYRQVLDMPFRTYLLWTYPLSIPFSYFHPWLDGFSAQESASEYAETYELARYLLTAYDGSGKSFLLGHWEGDNVLGSDITPTKLQGMRDWLRTRQLAVDQARQDQPHTNVFVWHYAEVNRVAIALTGAVTVVNDVLPHLTNDLISYSAYDTQHDPAALTSALAYIESKAPMKGPFARNAFIGEYGFPVNDDFFPITPQQQADRSKTVIKTAAGWGVPLVLYWEMYNNETNALGLDKGFWLIDSNNLPQPSYDLHQDFLGRLHAFKNQYRFWLGRNPDAGAVRSFSPGFETFQTANLAAQLMNSAEAETRWSDDAFIQWLFEELLGAWVPGDPETVAYAQMLADGTNRSAVLDAILDSPRFSTSCTDAAYACMLLGGTLAHEAVDPLGAEAQGLQARLAGGETRSALWKSFLNSNEFFAAELEIREDDTVGSPGIQAKHFFLRDRDRDGLDDVLELEIAMFNPGDALAVIEEVLPGDDFDGDGLSNLAEQACRTSPTDLDTDGDGLRDGDEVPFSAGFFDRLTSVENLSAPLNTRLEYHAGGIAFLRTNDSPAYTEAIVDWQPGGAGGGLFAVSNTPMAVIVPSAAIRGGYWNTTVQLFDQAGAYLGEPGWVPDGQQRAPAVTNVAELAASAGLGSATHFRVRFRIHPHNNGGTEPGFAFSKLAVLSADGSDPIHPDTDGDGVSDGEEHLAGTRPLDPTSFLRVSSAEVSPVDGLTIRWAGTTGIEYRVAGDLLLGTWNPLEEVSGQDQVLATTNPAAAEAGYYRLEAAPGW